MRISELFRLVWTNIAQNKIKALLTSVGIIVGAVTIVLVIAVGEGSSRDIAEQFKNLNAGAIDISYGDTASGEAAGDMGEMSFGDMPSMGDMPFAGGGAGSGSGAMPFTGGGSGDMPSGDSGGRSFGGGEMPSFGGDMGGFIFGGGMDNMVNERVTLTESDLEDISAFVPGIDGATISFSSRGTVTGGELEEETTYTVAGVESNYAEISNLELAVGEFLTDLNNENKEKVCILGSDIAAEIFGSALDAYDSIIYIDERPYTVNGVLEAMGTVSSGISPDSAIFIPYQTGIKYIAGSDANPTVTVIASDVDDIETVKADVETVLAETYPSTEFTITDAGSKMEAAAESSNTLQMLLLAMAAIVFVVGGIGIMNVLFVSVKERTPEIGILKAIGCTKRDILAEFLLEAAMISVIGGAIGVALSFVVLPVMESLGVSTYMTAMAGILAVAFAIITGTVFGFYPAWKASLLVPIEALNEE